MADKNIVHFNRCIYCFAEMESKGAKNKENQVCPVCGYANGLCSPKATWLSPGSILKGRYMTGKLLEEKKDELIYAGWDIIKECIVRIHEYYPEEWVQRDITVSEQVNCCPGKEELLEEGKQKFFERARLFYQCTSRVEKLEMDFFVRNSTCYYVRYTS